MVFFADPQLKPSLESFPVVLTYWMPPVLGSTPGEDAPVMFGLMDTVEVDDAAVRSQRPNPPKMLHCGSPNEPPGVPPPPPPLPVPQSLIGHQFVPSNCHAMSLLLFAPVLSGHPVGKMKFAGQVTVWPPVPS